MIVSGGRVRHSVLSPGVRVHSRALVEGSVLMDGVDIGRGAVVRNAIVDKNVRSRPARRSGSTSSSTASASSSRPAGSS